MSRSARRPRSTVHNSLRLHDLRRYYSGQRPCSGTTPHYTFTTPSLSLVPTLCVGTDSAAALRHCLTLLHATQVNGHFERFTRFFVANIKPLLPLRLVNTFLQFAFT